MLSTIALDTQVLRPGLCTGCGACQGLCPYWGSVDGRTVCFFDCERADGRCQRFCPRMPTDLDALRKQFFPEDTILPEIGPFLGLYLTRAADESIRSKAQHGGSMTALVELALKEGFIDAAALTRSQGGLNPEGVLAVTAEEVRACSGSSFQVPPTLAVLNKALKEDRFHSIGVVGTPCKTLAVYKMKANPLPENDNHAGNIGMVFGLFCGWGLDWDGLNALAAKHADPAKISHMDIPPSKYHSLDCPLGEGAAASGPGPGEGCAGVQGRHGGRPGEAQKSVSWKEAHGGQEPPGAHRKAGRPGVSESQPGNVPGHVNKKT